VSGAGRAIRWSTIAAVTAVAVVAGWVSYDHALAVVREHGEGGIVARLYPGTIDGLIYAASMVLLDSARRGVPAPPMARWLLAAGIGATVAANVLAGVSYGPLGAIVAAWPAAEQEISAAIAGAEATAAPGAGSGGRATGRPPGRLRVRRRDPPLTAVWPPMVPA
jgi:Protein of unknown function (DUF2637)